MFNHYIIFFGQGTEIEKGFFKLQFLVQNAIFLQMLNSKVLVLNRTFVPVHITTVKRAMALLYTGIAKALDREYRLFDFQTWSELSLLDGEEGIRTVNKVIKVPRVIVLTRYDKFPRRIVRFSRYNIFLRDKNRCQYCGRKLPKYELTIDHVIPRARGGKTTWENVVLCCIICNRRKGGRVPEEAGMRLIRKPGKPKWSPLYMLKMEVSGYKEWSPFLNVIDASYWNTELEES